MRGSFNIRPCVIEQIHAVEACSDDSFPRHSHTDYGIGLIVGGAQRSWSGRGVVEAGRGSLITCNPGEVHDGMPIGGARQWKMLYLGSSRVAALARDIHEGGSREFEFTQPVIGDSLLAGVFESLYQAVTDPAGEPLKAEERAILLLARLARPRSAPAGTSGWVARAKARIDDEPIPSVTLDELAREAGLSRFQLVRGFARSYGLTPPCLYRAAASRCGAPHDRCGHGAGAGGWRLRVLRSESPQSAVCPALWIDARPLRQGCGRRTAISSNTRAQPICSDRPRPQLPSGGPRESRCAQSKDEESRSPLSDGP